MLHGKKQVWRNLASIDILETALLHYASLLHLCKSMLHLQNYARPRSCRIAQNSAAKVPRFQILTQSTSVYERRHKRKSLQQFKVIFKVPTTNIF